MVGMDIGTQTAKEVAHECRSRWNVEETGEDSWGIDLMYFHTESDFQVIFSNFFSQNRQVLV